MRNVDTIGKFKVKQVPAIVPEHEVDGLAYQMAALYKECLAQVIGDDEVRFHVALMPEMTGSHYVFSANSREEEDLADAIEAILGVEVGADDCIILLGREMLSRDRDEDQMMEIVLSDIAVHIDRVWPVADTTAGWVGSYIGSAAIASIIASAHDVLRLLSPPEALVNRIKDMMTDGLLNDRRIRNALVELAQNRPAFEAIENVCDMALSTSGGHISLPTTARNLRNTAKKLYLEVVDELPQPLRTVI